MKNSSWKGFGDFKKMCNEEYLNKYADLPDDCRMLTRFQLAGTLVIHMQYILLTGFAMLITVYNILSAASKGWELELPILGHQVRLR